MQTMVPLYGFGGVPYSAVRKAAPRNLLDNSDFRNPVNQRGQTSIVVNNDVYTYFIDRWCFVDWSGNDAGTLTLTDGGISVTVEMLNFYQRFEKGVMDLTKSYTLAVCYDDGTIEINKNPLFSESAFDSISFTVMPGKTVSWAALYEGSYTAETLPEYQPKGYGAELAECRRYFVSNVFLRTISLNVWELMTSSVTFPTPMRILPTVKVSSFITKEDGVADVYVDGDWQQVECSVNDLSKEFASVGSTTGKFTPDCPVRLIVSASADL